MHSINPEVLSFPSLIPSSLGYEFKLGELELARAPLILKAWSKSLDTILFEFLGLELDWIAGQETKE